MTCIVIICLMLYYCYVVFKVLNTTVDCQMMFNITQLIL